MDAKWDVRVPIPDDLDEVIQQGIRRGKQVAERRRRIRQGLARCLCSFGVVAGMLIGGIHLSPAFAAAVEDVPVLGRLVQVFGKNQAVVQGGNPGAIDHVSLRMGREGSAEWIRLEFPQTDASEYQAEFASYPKTVTITLPGTSKVEILSQISCATDTSQYVKAVCPLPTSTRDTAIIQLVLESDADVQIQEYRDPGSLVIRLDSTEIQPGTIYSVRTLSMQDTQAAALAASLEGSPVRLLQDEEDTFFLEFGQFHTREEAEAFAQGLQADDVVIEERFGNHVPAAFPTMQAYQSAHLLDEYYQLLIHSDTVAPILAFLDSHFSQADPQTQDTMLRGLTGFLEDGQEESVDWARVSAYYEQAGQTLPEVISKQMQP